MINKLARALVIALAAVVVAGCSSAAVEHVKPLETITVKTVVAEPCVNEAPTQPDYLWGKGERPKEDKAALLVLIKDYEAAKQYGGEWEAAATGCVKSAQRASPGAPVSVSH